jgi:hypothetical protein
MKKIKDFLNRDEIRFGTCNINWSPLYSDGDEDNLVPSGSFYYDPNNWGNAETYVSAETLIEWGIDPETPIEEEPDGSLYGVILGVNP